MLAVCPGSVPVFQELPADDRMIARQWVDDQVPILTKKWRAGACASRLQGEKQGWADALFYVDEVFRLRWLVKRLAADKRTSEALIHQKSDVSDHLGLPAEAEIVKSGLEMLPKVIRDPAMEGAPKTCRVWRFLRQAPRQPNEHS